MLALEEERRCRERILRRRYYGRNQAGVQWNYDSFNVIPNVPAQVGLDIAGFANLGTLRFIVENDTELLSLV